MYSRPQLDVPSTTVQIVETALAFMCFSLGIQIMNRQVHHKIINAEREGRQNTMLNVSKKKWKGVENFTFFKEEAP